MKTLYKIILGIILVFIILNLGQRGNAPGGSKPAVDVTDWASVRSGDIASVSSGFNPPQWLDVSASGWEDGAYISADGNTLYFTYINVDLLNGNRVSGPDRDPTGICGSMHCGQFPRPDVFYLTGGPASWAAPVPHPLTIKFPIGGFFLQSEGKAYFHMDEGGTSTNIFFAEKTEGSWGEPQKIMEISSDYSDDDPFVTSDDNEMYFWSKRPASLGGDNIYRSAKVGGKWQAPEILPEPINSNSNDMQPFLLGDTLYFSSDREGASKIYASKRQGEGWGQPEVLVSSKYGVGEPTLTSDGKYLYFIQIFKSGDGAFNPDIMRAEKR